MILFIMSKMFLMFLMLIRVAISNFSVNSENLGIRIWQKNCLNYDKFLIATRLRISQI